MTPKNFVPHTYQRPLSTERRSSMRHPFTASATVVEPQTHARMSARTSDLDHMGCYIDTMNPFSEGTTVTLRLTKDNHTFNALAKVVFAHAGMGMGLSFSNPDPEQMQVLEFWLGKEAPSPRMRTEREVSQPQPESSQSSDSDNPEVLKYLILMLIQKEILLPLEGQALLEKLLGQPTRN